jgi:hypothetical protein
VLEIDSLYNEPTVQASVGDIIRVKEYANGGWALFLKVKEGAGTIFENYKLVGRNNGTIQIDKNAFIPPKGYGLDSIATFDANLYDIQLTTELRNILRAIKNDIFVEDLQVEWNNLFFLSIRSAFVQSPVVDWAFKTSFLNAIHNVGELDRRPSYKNDNIESFQSYIEEVKPYRTTIREYTSRYNSVDSNNTIVNDFDSPPAYLDSDGQILPIGSSYFKSDTYPWKFFIDNQGYAISFIRVVNGGSGYITAPVVSIEGTNFGASAQAYISNGRVTGIEVINSGYGYLSAPIVKLVGGNGSSRDIATAVAILGDGLIRSFNLGIKIGRAHV